MKPPMTRHEKTLICIAIVLLSSSSVLRHWLHTDAGPTMILFGFTFLIAGLAQYNKRTKAAQQPRQTPPPGPAQRSY